MLFYSHLHAIIILKFIWDLILEELETLLNIFKIIIFENFEMINA